MASNQTTAKHFSKLSFCLFGFGLFSLLLAFYWPFLSQQQSFYMFDITGYFEPMCSFIGDAFKAHHIPLWNPYLYLGIPQIAVPSPGIFYPFTWLFGLLDFNQALAAILLCHQLIAGLGAYLLVESFAWGKTSAVLAAALFALSGYMFSVQSNYTLLASVAWIPIAIWSLARIKGQISISNLLTVLFSAFCTYMLVTSGRPEICLPGFSLLVIVVLAQMVAAYKRSKQQDGQANGLKAKAAWQFLALCIAMLLAMPTILPTLEWFGLSRRVHGLPPIEVFYWSATWYDLLCIFLCHPLGDLTLLSAEFIPLAQTKAAYISSAYIGPTATTLAIFGLKDKSWSKRYLVLLVFVVSLLLALGDQTPVAPALASFLPAASLLRFPIKLIIFPVVCLILMAARGIYWCLQKDLARAPIYSALLFWLFCTVAGTILLALADSSWHILPYWQTQYAGVPIAHDLLIKADHQIGQGFLIAAALGLITCGITFFKDRLSQWAYIALILVMSLSPLALSAFTFDYHATTQAFFTEPSDLAQRMHGLSTPNLKLGNRHPRIAVIYPAEFDTPPWYPTPLGTTPTFYAYARQLLFPNTNVDQKITSIFAFEGSAIGDYQKIFQDILHNYTMPKPFTNPNDLPIARLMQMTGTKFCSTIVLVGRYMFYPEFDRQHFQTVDKNMEYNFHLYQLTDSLERAYFAGNWQWATHKQAMSAIINAQDSGFNAADKIFVEKPELNGQQDMFTSTHATWDATKAIPQTAPAGGKVAFLADAPEHIAISVKSKLPGFVVLADQFYPGWHAALDTEPVRIYRANAVERAVFVPAGSHLVEFDYQPESLSHGYFLAIVGLAIIASLLIWIYCLFFIRRS
jgi:hypothetical protein